MIFLGRVEPDLVVRVPVSCGSRPTLGVLGASLRVDGTAARQDTFVLAAVALARGNELDRGSACAPRCTSAGTPEPSPAPAPALRTACSGSSERTSGSETAPPSKGCRYSPRGG